MSGEWLSYAAARKRLGISKDRVENLVMIGVLKIRFEGTPKGVALRYSSSDVERIKAGRWTKEELQKEAEKLRLEQMELALYRQVRLEKERRERLARRERIAIEREEAARLEAERQRIMDAVRAARGAK